MAGPGRQRTFDLVPETLVPQNAPKKPMTMNQAKKAAAIASRQPKMSRAERARMEKEELDCQRKERERQRASEKAKAAREKKSAKLAEEKAERKRMGRPEPSRFVRGSQPAISAFVTMDSKRRKTEVVDSSKSFDNESRGYGNSELKSANMSPETYPQPDEDGGPETEKTTQPPSILSLPLELCTRKYSSPIDHEHAPGIQIPSPTTKPISMSPQPLPLVESLTSRQPPQTSISPIVTTKRNNLKVMCEKANKDLDEFDADTELFAAMAESFVEVGNKPLRSTVKNLAGPKKVQGDNLSGSEHLQSKSTRENAAQTAMPPPPLPRKIITAANKEVLAPGSRFSLLPSVLTPVRGTNSTNPTSFVRPLLAKPTNQISQSNNFTFGAQPLGNRSKNMPPPPPLTLKRHSLNQSAFVAIPPSKHVFPTNFVPSSTQAFLNDNLDSFFPSPTQEMRELEDDDSLDNLEDFFPTPTQEMRELNEEDEIARQLTPIISTTRREASPVAVPERLELNNTSVTPKPLANSLNVTQKKAKSRFFMEKEEDILHATEEAIARGDFDSSAQNPTLKRKFSRVASGSSDYDEDDMDWNSQEAMLALEIGRLGNR